MRSFIQWLFSEKPFVPSGWRLVSDQALTAQFDLSQVKLFLVAGQIEGIEGEKLRKELAGKPVLSALLLDWLLEHPHHIPEAWKACAVFFWGTIYSFRGKHLVRCLFWDEVDKKWTWGALWIENEMWDGTMPTAVLR